MIKRLLFIFLSILLGTLFIFSAWTKLYPIEPFEYTFVDMGISNWYLSPFFARILIAIEFFTGVLLLLNLYLRRFTIRFSIFILAVFCIYLTAQIIISGNNGNCGCFGEFLAMTPLQAIIKNLVLIVLLIVLYRFHDVPPNKPHHKPLLVTSFFVAFALPFILNPVELDYSATYLEKPVNRELPLDSLYKHAGLNVPPAALSNGKHVMAFMSLTCPHCRIAAKKIRIMHERQPSISFYLVLYGKADDLQNFYDDTRIHDVPHCMLERKTFVMLAGTSLPAIYMVNNSVVEKELDYFTMNEEELVKWVGEE